MTRPNHLHLLHHHTALQEVWLAVLIAETMRGEVAVVEPWIELQMVSLEYYYLVISEEHLLLLESWTQMRVTANEASTLGHLVRLSDLPDLSCKQSGSQLETQGS